MFYELTNYYQSKRHVPEDDGASIKRQRKGQAEDVSKDTLECTKGRCAITLLIQDVFLIVLLQSPMTTDSLQRTRNPVMLPRSKVYLSMFL